MAHEYEYKTLIEYLSPLRLGGSSKYIDEPARSALANAFHNLADSLPAIIDKKLGDGWQVNSHSITFQDEVCIVSMLLQRQRT